MSRFQIPLGRLLDSEPISVIDIGSNSIRLNVYEGARRSPSIIFSEKVTCALGRSLDDNGLLSEESMQKAFLAFRRFRALSRQLGSTKIHAIATAAPRDAANGTEFIEKSEKILTCKINLLSGEEEASLAALGVISGIYKADGIVADMGGGSIELTNIVKQKIRDVLSLPLGALRLQEMAPENPRDIEDIVQKYLLRAKWIKKQKGRTLYLVGGTWRAIARLQMHANDYPLKFLHNYSLSPTQITDFIETISSTPLDTLPGVEEISKSRRETLIYGAFALKQLIEVIEPDKIVFSNYGVREGVLFNLLSDKEKQQDPLYAASYDFAALRARSPQNSEELCDWTDRLFRAISIKESKAELRLRHAACLLSDIAWRTHPEYRGKHSINLIAQGAFGGMNHQDRVSVALSVFFRHEGRFKARELPEISNLLNEPEIERARLIGLAIRLANIISANMPDILPDIPIYTEGKKLILELPEPYATLEGARVLKRLTTLAQFVQYEPEIR